MKRVWGSNWLWRSPLCFPFPTSSSYTLFTESKGRGKRHAQDSSQVLGMIAEPNRNRRASALLSPVLVHFHSPSSFLHQKLQQLLQQDPDGANPSLLPIANRHPGPAKPQHGIPTVEWPTVLCRVMENHEPLREIADDYGVSYETVRRIVLAARKQSRTG
jgi:hypothetical protein